MKKYALILAMIMLSPSVLADWTLHNEQSSVNFISVKKSSIAEVHGFKVLSGAVSDNGKVSLNIDLSSVETNIGIRNDRMQSMLFEVSKYSQANITGTVNVERVKKMKAGETHQESVTFKLSLHGVEKSISTKVAVTKLAENKVMVSSLKPIVVNAADFGLTAGVDALMKVAGLPSISMAVPVTFNLLFK